MSFLSFLGGTKKSEKIREYYENGAVVLDVRSPGEFASGHAKGSKNIPLQNINGQLNQIKKWNKPVIACCQSGMRSGSAKSILQNAGIECINGGSWTQVQKALS